MTILRWLLSHTVRQATELRKHVVRIMRAQKDLLSPQAIDAITKSAAEMQAVVVSGADKKAIQAGMTKIEEVANKWLKPYPHAAWRENVEVLLVAVAVAMAIRTFFLQPMKIPTGSMQPTLFGITHENLINKPDVEMPHGLTRWFDSWVKGISYYHYVAKEDGVFRWLDPSPRPFSILGLFNVPFVTTQSFAVGNDTYTVWFPGENFPSNAGVLPGQSFKHGEDVIKMKVIAGDHLFVNRLTYNFRHPKRGEIVIFETHGIEDIQQQDTFYIKRLVALGGEHVRIGDDHHLIIDGKRLDSNTPHFENVYNFGPEFKENSYFGHVNGVTLQRNGRSTGMRYFRTQDDEFCVATNHYMVMGDNTMNSSDSRYWGDFPREKVIGKGSFVYWPISSRFGWGQR
jgi:signal peptidase I